MAGTVPQAGRLLRARGADNFAWGFLGFNLAGIGLLAWRSREIRAFGFLAVTRFTAAFWAFAIGVKARRYLGRESLKRSRLGPSAPERGASSARSARTARAPPPG